MLPRSYARFALIGVLCAASVLAQDAPFILKVDVAMVTLDVSVFAASGVPVTNLSEDDFLIYEDGRPQRIRTFAATDSPYNMLLVLDRSGSMSREMPMVIQAVNRFMANLRQQDQVAIAAFDDSFDVLSGWRSVREGSRREIKLAARGMSTRFYDAITKMPRELQKVSGRKGVLIYSDGEDSAFLMRRGGDEKNLQNALKVVRQAGVPFHFVGVTSESRPGALAMKQLADASGGHVLLTDSIEGIGEFYDKISREMGVSYTLGYLSDRPQRDGARRRIEVVLPGRNYRVSQSRNGYDAN